HSAGFTLIELCLLLALFAILSAFAVPSFSATLAQARARASLDRLTGDLYLARALAARAGRPVSLRFEPAAGCAAHYLLLADDERVLRRVTAAPEVTGVCLRSNVARAMRIDARGMLVGSPRRLVATAGAAADSVTVSIVGRVYRWR